MKGMLTLHLWNPPPRFYTPSLSTKPPLSISATSSPELLTAKERRRLRNERRESNATNWKEEVENKLIQKTKKVNKSWKDELNLDNLMKLGPQWWGVRVSRVKGQYTAEALARSLAKFFPDIEFKVCVFMFLRLLFLFSGFKMLFCCVVHFFVMDKNRNGSFKVCVFV